jgi:hypothetical protein
MTRSSLAPDGRWNQGSPVLLVTVAATILLSGSTPAASLQRAEPPGTLQLEAGEVLTRVGHATRAELFGGVETYTIGLYLDSGGEDFTRLASPDTAKALRFEVLYSPDIRPRIVQDWTRELVPSLEAQATAHLRGSFAPLRAGDQVLIAYWPGKGTTVRVNKAAAVAGANHDLILAFLDHWLGQRPFSEEIKLRLLGRR